MGSQKQLRDFVSALVKVLCSLVLVLSVLLLPERVWPLAPSSDTTAAQKATERLQRLRTAITTDRNTRNKIDEADLDMILALGIILDPDAIENAIKNKENSRMDFWNTANVIRRVGQAEFLATLEHCAQHISPRAFSDAFSRDPLSTVNLVSLFKSNPSRGDRLIEKIGTAVLAKAFQNNTHLTYLGLYILFNRNLDIEQGFNALVQSIPMRDQEISQVFTEAPYALAQIIAGLSTFTPADFHNLWQVFDPETYRMSLRGNPSEFAGFMRTVYLLRTDVFREMLASGAGRTTHRKSEMEHRFRRNASSFLVSETGLLFEQWGEIAEGMRAKKSTDHIRYYRKVPSAICAAGLWEELFQTLAPTPRKHIKVLPFEHIISTRRQQTLPSTTFRISLTLGRSEQERLRIKGIFMKDAEIGAIKFHSKNGKLIVEEMQSYVQNRREKIPQTALERYGAWPYYLWLALEDYARSQGLTEIVLPSADWVYATAVKKVPEENLLPTLHWLYEEVPTSLGFVASRKNLSRRPSHALQAYRQLLQPDIFFENFVHVVERKKSGWTSPMDNIHAVRDTLRAVIAQESSPSALRRSVREAWERSSAKPAPLVWNYTVTDKRGFTHHGLSLGGTDFVFTVDPRTRDVQFQAMGRYPSLAGVSPGELAGTESAAAFEWQWRLSKWPTATVISVLPTLLDMARTFADDRPHAQHLRSEYLRVLGALLESIPPDPAALTTLIHALAKEWPALKDSDRIELLHVLKTAMLKLETQDRWALSPDDLKKIQNWVHCSAHMLRSNLAISSKVLRTVSPKNIVPVEFFDGAKTLFESFAKTNVGRARQAIVLYTAFWLTFAQHDPSTGKPIGVETFSVWANAASKLLEIFDAEKASSALRDDFLTQLLLTRRCPSSLETKILWPLLKIALEDKHTKAADLLGMTERLELISRRFSTQEDMGPLEAQIRGIPRTVYAAKMLVNQWLEKSQKEWEKPYLKTADAGVLTATPDLALLLELSKALRASPPIVWNSTSWRMRVDFDNPLLQPMVSVSLIPSAKTKSADPALELLGLDFSQKDQGNEFIQSPRNTLARIDMFVGAIGGKTTLFWMERQAAKAFSKIRKCSAHPGVYRRWLKELARQILIVARALPQIEQVLSLSGAELLALEHWQHLDKQVITENYGTRTFLSELGFRKKAIDPYQHLEFSSTVAFMGGVFSGPFWALDLRASPLDNNLRENEATLLAA